MTLEQIKQQFLAETQDRGQIKLRENRNALRPTGPRTPAGKDIASRNSLKHGLTARQVVIPGESQEEFDQLLDSLTAERQPCGETETHLIAEIAAGTWRLARARQREAEMLATQPGLFSADSAAGFDRLLRYMGSIERQLHRSIVLLKQQQAERRALAQAASAAESKPKAMAAGASGFVSSSVSSSVVPAGIAPPPPAQFVSSSVINAAAPAEITAAAS